MKYFLAFCPRIYHDIYVISRISKLSCSFMDAYRHDCLHARINTYINMYFCSSY